MINKAISELFLLIKESLTNPDKEYSSKKMMTFMSFNLCVLMSLADQFTAYKINIDVFYSFLMLASGTSILNIISNKLLDKNLENIEK